MTQHLTQHFVSLRGQSFTSQTFAKLRLNHGERSLNITALVIVLHELILIRHVLMIHRPPKRRLSVVVKPINVGSSFERNIGLRSAVKRVLKQVEADDVAGELESLGGL
jgi:hypothetical protein